VSTLAFWIVVGVGIVCLVGPVLLFLIALCKCAADADEIAREHAQRRAERKRLKRVA
jgi:hypothetical protein